MRFSTWREYYARPGSAREGRLVVETSVRPGEDLRGYRNALGSFGTGVAVVTGASEGRPFGMTINSFSSVSLQPALVLWSIDSRATHYHPFLAAERFAIHVLGADQKDVSDRFAATGGDKFTGVAWELDDSGVPRLLGCLARFQCLREAIHPGGDHEILLGRVELFETMPGAPLLFVQGRYLEAQGAMPR